MIFTKITSKVKLVILSEEDRTRAEKLLHKAEETCLISNSLNADLAIDCMIEIDKS
jgi:organic hydroperoxide reductase OsmC/OhrA